MKELTPPQMLDMVLKHLTLDFQNNIDDIFKTDTTVYKLSDSLKINIAEMVSILNKLVKDEFVESTHYDDDDKDYFMITFDGRYFILNGGYVQKAKDEKSARELRDSRDKRLSNGTVWLAIGTFLLVLWEICKTCILHVD